MAVKTCSHCGKLFIPGAQHMYKQVGKIFCSYSCYRAEGGDSAKKKSKPKKSITRDMEP